MRALIYLALGVVSVGLGVVVSFGFPIELRVPIMILTWMIGVILIELRVSSEPVEEENEKDGSD